MILIRGGRVVTSRGVVDADLWVEGDRVAGIGTYDGGPVSQEIDATGFLVGPGLVDVHVHFREPGQTWKEDIETGSRAAAAGGFTGVVMMPNTDPAIDNPGLVRELLKRSDAIGIAQVGVAGALTVGRRGEEATNLEGMHDAGVRIFSDDGDGVDSDTLMLEIATRLSHIDGATLAQHAEVKTDDLTLPVSVETEMVERDLGIVRATGVRYHLQHVSAAATVDLLRSARAADLPVTAEVTPHHLALTSSAADDDPNFKMYPPLRSEADRDALVRGLADGAIDLVATDHAPHTVEEKAVQFATAPRGVIGLETAAAVVWSAIHDPVRFFQVMSTIPATIAGFDRQGVWPAPGSPANLVVLDPVAEWVPTEFASRSSNSPFLGATLTGRVLATIYEGRITMDRVAVK